jgi:outer membrane immunogenic protein
MNKLLISSIAALGLIGTPAFAADMAVKAPPPAPVVAPYSWTGFYVGGTAGGAWGSFNPTTSTECVAGGFFTCGNPQGVNAAGAQSIKPTGFTGGFEAGYNWQTSNFVFGVEGDIEYFRLSGSATTTAAYPLAKPGTVCPDANGNCFTINSSASTSWLSTVRGRVGVAANNWLFYATGGAAFTNLQGNFTFSDTSPVLEAASISTDTRVGYTAGGGLEVGLGSHWSVKAEYLYVNFGTISTTGFLAPQPLFHSIDLKANIVRVGLNYQFH